MLCGSLLLMMSMTGTRDNNNRTHQVRIILLLPHVDNLSVRVLTKTSERISISPGNVGYLVLLRELRVSKNTAEVLFMTPDGHVGQVYSTLGDSGRFLPRDAL